ncbi:glycoside hydrolase family 38 C-terminal domain-containing protein [Devosia sp. FKR38]|uniref:alpha-mannosidase n=1 Tax=Devosia sp. FKR38 TaxID=2562312 RepID=UPI0010BFF83D|nr:glycoside hydrolase family 38 C-terminal domain-containing protein [Devosia sp. FKR38]
MRHYRDRQRNLEQLTDHLDTWREELVAWELHDRSPIGPWTLQSPEGEVRSIVVGDAWSNRFGIHSFRSGLLTVAGRANAELRLDFGGEALVRLFAEDGTQLDAFGANPQHKRFAPLPQVPFVIVAEVAARSLFGIPNRDPRLEIAEIVSVEPQIRALRRRIETICSTAQTVKDAELARSLCDVAEIGLSQLRLPTATAIVGPRLADQTRAQRIWERSFEPTNTPALLDADALASVDAAIAAIDAGLAELRQRYPKQGKILATGHAHIDYVWLWPQPETVRKIVRTFNSVNSLMDKHPEFTFLQSSSLFYKHVEQEDPALFEAIKQRIADGQWEVNGGMLIECDTNMPSAEAFMRQFLLGQAYFQRHFGFINRTAWLPDTFGFTGAMPQIMVHAGIETLVTIKVSWSETNKMPENLFRWKGNDGSTVLVHTYNAYDNDGYNMLMRPQALDEVWSKHAGKDLTDTVIATYGWGDGGGGPDPDQIEAFPILNLMPQLPAITHGNIQQHIDTISAELRDAAVPVWSGEMYLEYHRATLTTQARTKQLNRRAELALVAAEATSVLAALSGAGAAMPVLGDDWELMLRNQFHDILPGSSIREAYVQTEAELEGIVARSEAIAAQALARMAGRSSGAQQGLAVANISGTAKPHWQIQSHEPLPASLAPQQVGDLYIAASDRALAPLSLGFVAEASTRRVTVSDRQLENDLVRVTIDAHGRIASLFDKRRNRELIDGAANRLMVYRNDLPRNYDAWDIEPGFSLGGEELLELESCTVTASGPHLGEITIVRTLSASRITQKLRLWSNSPRLDIVTDIDWHDRRTYLRAVFPVTVMAEQAAFDQAIGVTQRATHDNTTWQQAQFEACGHRFVSLGEADWGAALLSADKYGFSAKGNVMTLSLVRGPMYPDMLADEGHHHFTYAIMPHDGRWWSPEVQSEADLLVDPLRFTPASAEAGYDIAPVQWSGLDMRLHALKPAESGDGYVLRLSESAGRRGALAVSLPEGRVAQAVDGLERPVDQAEATSFTPFHLASIRF